MSTNFLSLPSEIRNQIYELVLLSDTPILHLPWNYSTTNLFVTCKAIYREASSLFYARNRFHFAYRPIDQIETYLNRIGHRNAQYIQQVFIEFPNLVGLKLDNGFADFETNFRILETLHHHCPNLQTIKLNLDHMERAIEDRTYELFAVDGRLEHDELRRHPVVSELCGEIVRSADARFRSFPALQEVVADAYGTTEVEGLRLEIKKCGWTLIEHQDEMLGLEE